MAIFIERGQLVSNGPRYGICLYARPGIERAMKTVEWFLFGVRWWVPNTRLARLCDIVR